MQVTKIYCDHCGKELTDKDDYIDSKISTPTKHIETDLCYDCTKKLNKIIMDWLKELGVYCSYDTFRLQECERCAAKEYCDRYKEFLDWEYKDV